MKVEHDYNSHYESEFNNVTPNHFFTPRHMGLGSADVSNAAKHCMLGINKSLPPEFCWKKGGDVGIIPTGCPSGFHRELALCYKYCPSGYRNVLGVCW